MMRVMVVDDEWASVDVLKTEIDWASYGFHEVLHAYNLKQSVEQFQYTEIDLLVCDIEMPQGSGLELAEYVRSHSPSTLIIFLTCHDKFSFAQKALQLGCYDYILKPIEFEEFNSILSRAVDEIRQNQIQSGELQELEKYYHLWQNKKADLVEKFWQDLLDDRIVRKRKGIEHELLAYAPAAYWAFEVLPVLVSIERWHQAFEQADEEILEYALRNAAIDFVLDNRRGIVFQDHSGINIILIYIYTGDDDQWQERVLPRACETYIRECAKLFYCDVSCYIGWQVPIVDIMTPYNALRFEEQNQITASRQVIRLQGNQNMASSRNVTLPNFFEWADWIVDGNERKLNAAIQESVDQLKHAEITAADVQRVKQEMAKGLLYSLKKKGYSEASEASFFEQELTGFVKQSIVASELKIWIETVAQRAMEFVQRMEWGDTVVHTVKKLIKNALSEDLNRESLAAAVHLNPGYLSRLFKKETGYSLTDYITHERMKQATELLKTRATVTEIALAVGYSYQSHFSKMFKKTFKMSPQEYRKALQSAGTTNGA
ncbi:helix-turn-helix domain-containing protein [Cohnella sp. LGH]|uniref:response regulator transcription factor n=1 Tax=Cohnella sp. LGH TaxID=1619153 RepID=UPI001ADCA8E4|nr:helix-turn-helix domain-containing protein [Cohnella sp. LGH]QTH41531.1 helix-turn-helix domain-containing protein [Cohnella sp. LGH]